MTNMPSPSNNLSLSNSEWQEPYRPQIHFSPKKNWINDPNGLVYFKGEYHLFYQYNPHGSDWGHMSWGHAVSRDLVHWEELPVAIPEQEDIMIFSGSIIVDEKNTSGLGDGVEPPLLAYFTAHDEAKQLQNQHLAYSHDRGRTWQHYQGNPIIDLDSAHFRDPSVFWHKETQKWVMVIALAQEHKVLFYQSDNLINWQLVDSFGPAGNTGGQWECACLMEVPIAESHDTAWVLKIDVDKDMVGEGSGAQYFVGNFDGRRFTDQSIMNPKAFTADFGGEFYAAITWSNLPAIHNNPVWIGWFSNHQTGRFFPTSPWRGSMTVPRELFLYREDNFLQLGQKPIPNLQKLRDKATQTSEVILQSSNRISSGIDTANSVLELIFDVTPDVYAIGGIVLVGENDTEIKVGYDRVRSEVFVDRRKSNIEFDESFAAIHVCPVSKFKTRGLHLIIDKSSIEVFIDDGRQVISDKFFIGPLERIDLFSEGGASEFRDINAWSLNSIHAINCS